MNIPLPRPRWPRDTEAMPGVSDYYRAALEEARREVEATPDDRVIAIDTEEWVEHLIARHALAPLEPDTASDAMVFEQINYRGYPAALVTQRIEPSETFDLIARHGLTGQGPWMDFDYRTFFSEDRPYTLGQFDLPEPNHVK